MQILHPFRGSIQQYGEEISDANRYRPAGCPQCQAQCPLIAHGFYCRTLVDVVFDGVIRVRRYLCRLCKRTVSLLPDFALPYNRKSTRLNSSPPDHLVCRLLLEKKKQGDAGSAYSTLTAVRIVFGAPAAI